MTPPILDSHVQHASQKRAAVAAVAPWLPLVGLVVVGAALRFYRLGSPLWFDEIVTLVESARHPMSQIVTHFPGNNQHPLYSVLARLSIVAFGESAWSLRLPAALLGIGSIPMLYVLGRAVTTRREAMTAAVALTVSYHHVWFSQNARAYTALLLCALVTTFALVRWLDTRRRTFLLLYAVVTAVGAYAHLTNVLVSVGRRLRWRPPRCWTGEWLLRPGTGPRWRWRSWGPRR
jgi:uncharacterized membrane protein